MTVLAILGPTASGKSTLALEVARARIRSGRPTEIVAVDAFTVYRGMDVGTAKPTAEQRAEVAHHLVDVIDPWQELNVADFQALARTAIADILDRGATPLLVGGSGLYWRAVVDDLRFPPADPLTRSALETRWGNDPDGAHACLAAADPAAAASIAPENLRRTVRALEVIALTGELFSTYDDAWSRYETIYPDLEVGFLDPPTPWLRARIHDRTVAMIEAGLLDEAADLRRLARPLSRTAVQGIGYAEAFAVLDGTLPADALVETIATRTWRYAKRQRSWFHADPRCVGADPDGIRTRLTAA